jgi:membrane peptidoglycan carboxypeptidase
MRCLAGSHHPVTAAGACAGAYPVSVLTSGPLRKIGVAGRLALLAVISGVLAAALVVPAVGVAGMAVRNAANKFNTLSTPELGQLPVRSQILDDHGKLLAYYYPRGIDRVPVTYAQIAPVMSTAIVAIEDSRFWEHGAIDFKGTVRAVVNNLQHKAVQGGSTLAQQYVKNVLILSSANPQQEALSAASGTVSRKIRELRMAVEVEHQMTKDDLLAGYLNVAPFGGEVYGIEIASQYYFHTHAADLTLTEAALLAGMVDNPSLYDPIQNPAGVKHRRNIVLTRMLQLGDITKAQELQAKAAPMGLHIRPQQAGCTASSAAYAAYFCDYTLAVLKHDAAFQQAWARLQGMGGLTIYTTIDRQDQNAAQKAVNYELPPPPSDINPGGNADTEVMVQPGTGDIRAIAIDRPYGMGPHQNTVDYAVGPEYNGGEGAQIGSTGKVFTMVAALEQGIPFGYSEHVNGTAQISGYTNCQGQPVGQPLPNGQLGWSLTNDQSELGTGTYTLYTGTTASINTFFAPLEQKVGLCNVVKTAAAMGLTWPNGASLLTRYAGNHGDSADDDPPFTLGSDNVTPLSVAAADATLPARGIACRPVAITKIVTTTGSLLPVESAGCHRVMSTAVADAANYILAGDLTVGTATSDQIPRPAASKTGTADNYASAFFVGYTPDLLGAVWVGSPNGLIPMAGTSACYRLGCVGLMYGSEAPGNTWQTSFLHAKLDPSAPGFVPVDPASPLWSLGNGLVAPHPKPTASPTPGGGHGGGGGGTPVPTIGATLRPGG